MNDGSILRWTSSSKGSPLEQNEGPVHSMYYTVEGCRQRESRKSDSIIPHFDDESFTAI